jgi:hypothetical protein
MSYIFEIGEDTVWSPALRVGELYVVSTRCIADARNQPTGLVAIANDMYKIDLPAFERLTRSVLSEYLLSNHPIYREQLRPWLLASLVMLQRGGVSIDPESNEQANFIRQAEGYARSMPT